MACEFGRRAEHGLMESAEVVQEGRMTSVRTTKWKQAKGGQVICLVGGRKVT